MQFIGQQVTVYFDEKELVKMYSVYCESAVWHEFFDVEYICGFVMLGGL